MLQKIHEDFDISPIVLITKIDKVFKDHIFESSQVFEYGLCHKYIKELASLLPSVSEA